MKLNNLYVCYGEKQQCQQELSYRKHIARQLLYDFTKSLLVTKHYEQTYLNIFTLAIGLYKRGRTQTHSFIHLLMPTSISFHDCPKTTWNCEIQGLNLILRHVYPSYVQHATTATSTSRWIFNRTTLLTTINNPENYRSVQFEQIRYLTLRLLFFLQFYNKLFLFITSRFTF